MGSCVFLTKPNKNPILEAARQSIIFLSSSSSDDDPDNCAICLESVIDNEKCKLIPCEHYYCQMCLFHWINIKPCCPVCRRGISKLMFKSGNSYNEVQFHVNSLLDILCVNTTLLNLATKCLYQKIKYYQQFNIIPINSITIEDVKKVIPSNKHYNVSVHIFRCFVYKYNLSPIYDTPIQVIPTEKEKAAEHKRLFEFALKEMEILKVFYNFEVDLNNFKASLTHIFNFYDIKTCEFRFRLKSLIRKFCTFSSKITNELQTFSFKFYTELNHFANAVVDYNQYIKTIKYQPCEEKIITISDSDKSEVEVIACKFSNEKKAELEKIAIKFAKRNNKYLRPLYRNLVIPGSNNDELSISSSSSTGKKMVRKKRNTRRTRNSSQSSKNSFQRSRNSQSNRNLKFKISEMRRIIRKARHSKYFSRKLLLEIKKKFAEQSTILNHDIFAYRNDYFKEIYLSSKDKSKPLIHKRKQRSTWNGIDRYLGDKRYSISSFSSDDSFSESQLGDIGNRHYQSSSKGRPRFLKKKKKKTKTKKNKTIHYYSSDDSN